MKDTHTSFLWTNLRKFSIKKRLNYSIAFLVLIPIIFIILLTHIIFNKSMKKTIQTYSEALMDQLGTNMENEVEWLEECGIELVYSDSFQNMVQNQQKVDWDFLNNYRLVSNVCRMRFGNKKYVQSVAYLASGEQTYLLFGKEYPGMQDNMKEITSDAEEQETPYYWYYPERAEEGVPGLYLVNRVRKLATGEIGGIMIIGLNERFLRDIYEDIEKSLGEGTAMYTINTEGILVSGSREEYEKIDASFLLDTFSGEQHQSTDFEIEGKEYMTVWKQMGTTGWYMFALIPYFYIHSVSNSTSILMVFIGVVVLILGFTIAATINTSIVIPLNHILEYTFLLREGQFEQQIKDEGEDEIRQLAEGFNCATAEIHTLMQNIQEQTEQKAKLEFDALQAQINPHFLANTLNTISYLAKLRGMEHIENIANALTNILVVSMGKESKIITLEKEISYVKDYLLIQSYRFADFYQVEFEIPEVLLSQKIPKFVLQPIVENAIVHGVSQMEEREGIVRIQGSLENQEIHLSVTDNGPGISEELQRELLAGSRSEKGICGLGVKSVDQRLKLLFGDSYGITILSRPGFTVVELVFPANERDIDEDDIDCG